MQILYVLLKTAGIRAYEKMSLVYVKNIRYRFDILS